jgi:hypothetical protein
MKLKISAYVLLFGISIFFSYVATASDAKFFKPVFLDHLSIQTVGNHSYIRIGVYQNPDGYSSEILAILEEFENLNPDKDVVGWGVEKQQKGYSMIFNYIFGLWIDHKPKKVK